MLFVEYNFHQYDFGDFDWMKINSDKNCLVSFLSVCQVRHVLVAGQVNEQYDIIIATASNMLLEE